VSSATRVRARLSLRSWHDISKTILIGGAVGIAIAISCGNNSKSIDAASRDGINANDTIADTSSTDGAKQDASGSATGPTCGSATCVAMDVYCVGSGGT
jgi:hypothetical protein